MPPTAEAAVTVKVGAETLRPRHPVEASGRSPIRDNAFFPRRLPPRVNFASIVLELLPKGRRSPRGRHRASRTPLVNSSRNWELCNHDICRIYDLNAFRTKWLFVSVYFEAKPCRIELSRYGNNSLKFTDDLFDDSGS